MPITGSIYQSELINQVKAFNPDLKYKDDIILEYEKETDSVIMFSSNISSFDKEVFLIYYDIVICITFICLLVSVFFITIFNKN